MGITAADCSQAVQQRVREAAERGRLLEIMGRGSRRFLGRLPEGEPLRLAGHCGIVSYEPEELVITVRAGTAMIELDGLLAEQGQMLPFEPPLPDGSVGGIVASAWAGPRRPFTGSVRDAVLGLRCIDGRGRLLAFGGRVVKNVAGFDVSRLMCGALGTLGVVLEVTFRLWPRPVSEATFCLPCTETEAIARMTAIARQGLPLTGLAWHDGRLWLRLSCFDEGDEPGGFPGDRVESGSASFWQGLRDQTWGFFIDDGPPLWRISVPPAAAAMPALGRPVMDWGGALRWYRTDVPAGTVHELASRMGGAASCLRHGDRRSELMSPLPAPLIALNARIKQAMDPADILNRGRLFAAF